MQFNAKEIKESLLLPDGKYHFRVKNSREKRSQAGNDMINLNLLLDHNGKKVPLFDSLILIPRMFWKVEHFCKATGMPEKIEEGNLMACDCDNKEGYLELVTKQDQQSGELVNQVKDYILDENLHPADELNDDLNF